VLADDDGAFNGDRMAPLLLYMCIPFLCSGLCAPVGWAAAVARSPAVPPAVTRATRASLFACGVRVGKRAAWLAALASPAWEAGTGFSIRRRQPQRAQGRGATPERRKGCLDKAREREGRQGVRREPKEFFVCCCVSCSASCSVLLCSALRPAAACVAVRFSLNLVDEIQLRG